MVSPCIELSGWLLLELRPHYCCLNVLMDWFDFIRHHKYLNTINDKI
jgi:hypothetical protein